MEIRVEGSLEKEMGWMCGDGGWEGEVFLSSEETGGVRVPSRDSDVGRVISSAGRVGAAWKCGMEWRCCHPLPLEAYGTGGRTRSLAREGTPVVV
jgi:hypothetical protein